MPDQIDTTQAASAENSNPNISDYRPAIWMKDDVYYLHHAGLAIIIRDGDLDKAYDMFVDEVKARMSAYEVLDCVDLFPASSPKSKGRGIDQGSKNFRESFKDGILPELLVVSLKTFVVLALVGIVLSFSADRMANWAESKARTAFNSVAHKITSQTYGVAGKGRETLRNVATVLKEAPQDKVEDFQSDLRIIAQAVRPFLTELLREDGDIRGQDNKKEAIPESDAQ